MSFSEKLSVLHSSHIISDLDKISYYISFLYQGRLVFCEEKDRMLEKYGFFHTTNADHRTDYCSKYIMGYLSSLAAIVLVIFGKMLDRSFRVEEFAMMFLVLCISLSMQRKTA